MPGVYIYYLRVSQPPRKACICWCLLKLSLRSQITCPAGKWSLEPDLSGS